MEGPVWAHFMALPLPHTPTINNDLYFPKQFLLFYTSETLYILFFLPEMTFSSWQTLPPHRQSWRVSSSMKCTISPKADFSLLGPPQTWCPSLLTAHTAVTSMFLTGPWTFIVKWNKWMNDDGDHYDLAHYEGANTQQYGHSFWWAWYPRGYLGNNHILGQALHWLLGIQSWTGFLSLPFLLTCEFLKGWQKTGLIYKFWKSMLKTIIIHKLQ